MTKGRKGNHEGSIYKDKQGRWRGLVSMPSVNGKYKRKYIYGKTRKEVSEKVNAIGRSCITATIPLPLSARLLNIFISSS